MSLAATPVNEDEALTADLDRGQATSDMCAECHGTDGNASDEAIPKLASQYPKYLLKQLQDYQAGTRSHVDMTRVTIDLEPQAMFDLAHWFSDQSRTRNQANPLIALRGKRIYLEGSTERRIAPCAGCHGKRGQGYEGVFRGGIPKIGAQHAKYVRTQLRAFRDGSRDNDYRGLMQNASSKLTDEDIEGLAEYVAGLSPPGTKRSE